MFYYSPKKTVEDKTGNPVCGPPCSKKGIGTCHSPVRKQDPEKQLLLSSPWGTQALRSLSPPSSCLPPGGGGGAAESVVGGELHRHQGGTPACTLGVLGGRGRGLPITAESTCPVYFLPTGLQCICSVPLLDLFPQMSKITPTPQPSLLWPSHTWPLAARPALQDRAQDPVLPGNWGSSGSSWALSASPSNCVVSALPLGTS